MEGAKYLGLLIVMILVISYFKYKNKKKHNELLESFYYKGFTYKKIKVDGTVVYFAECSYDSFLSYYMNQFQYEHKQSKYKEFNN